MYILRCYDLVGVSRSLTRGPSRKDIDVVHFCSYFFNSSLFFHCVVSSQTSFFIITSQQMEALAGVWRRVSWLYKLLLVRWVFRHPCMCFCPVMKQMVWMI